MADTHEHTHTHVHEDGTVHTHTHTDGTVHTHSHGHGHKHVHSVEEKKAVTNRLARIIGHLEHVKSMVENDEDCSDVLIQLAAVRSALNNAGRVILTNHVNHCVKEAVEEGDMETIDHLNDAIKLFLK